MYKKIALLVCIAFASVIMRASHIVGGQLEVKWISGNNFDFKLHFYRNCAPGATAMPPTLPLCIYDRVTNQFIDRITLTHSTTTPLTLGDICYAPPECVELGEYSITASLPNNPNGYYITVPWGNRNAGIQNIVSSGVTYYAEIPDPALHNSSPVFNNYPKAYFCLGFTNFENFAATDIDGDSLVYSLTDPLEGSKDVCNSAPFNKGPYNPGYSLANIMGTGSTISVDNHTGILTVNPANLGLYVLTIKVEEFRNGIKIGEVNRDMQDDILNCTADVPPAFTTKPSSPSMTIVAGTDTCFNITLKDENDDWIVLKASSADMLSGNHNNPVMTYQTDSVHSPDSAKTTVCINTSCLNVRPAPYKVTFIGADTSCHGRNVVSLSYDIYVVSPPSVPPVFTQYPTDSVFTILAGNDTCFDLTLADQNKEWIVIDANGSDMLSGNPNNPVITFQHDSVLSPDSAKAHVCINTSCLNVRVNPYKVTFVGSDTSCFGRNRVSRNYYVKVVMPPNIPPVFTQYPTDSVFTVFAGSDTCFDLTLADQNKDWIVIDAKGSDMLSGNPNNPVITFQHDSVLSPDSSKAHVCINTKCINVRANPYKVTFVGLDTSSCYGRNRVYRNYYVKVVLPPNIPPIFTQYPIDSVFTIFAGSDTCFDLTLADQNKDWIVIDAKGSDMLSGNPNNPILTFQHDSVLSPDSAKAHVCINTKCINVGAGPYKVTFVGADTSCNGRNKVYRNYYVNVVLSPNIPPVFTKYPHDSVINIAAWRDTCFDLTLTDQNKDWITIKAQSADMLSGNPNNPVLTFQNDSVLSPDSAKAHVCINTSCLNMRTEPYKVTFVGLDTSCNGRNRVYINYYIHVIVPPNNPPVFIVYPKDSTFTVIAGRDSCFDLALQDSDLHEWIVISALDSSLLVGSKNHPGISFTKDSVETPNVSRSNVCVSSTCDNVRSAPFVFTFVGSDKSCGDRNDVHINCKIYVTPPPMLENIPNVFTPNGDNINDYFTTNKKYSSCYDKFYIKIYNRWGLLEFESNDYNFKWDGVNAKSSVKSSAGVYYFIINSSYQGVSSTEKGFVELIR